MLSNRALIRSFLLSPVSFFLYVSLFVSVFCSYRFLVGNDTMVKDNNYLRIATYNIRRQGKEKLPAHAWANRLPAVINVLKTMQPDIIGLQEPTKQQINDLVKELKDYAWFGDGRGESWGGRSADEYNPIFYNKERLILHEKGTFQINEWQSWQSWLWQPHVIGLLPRICTWGIFEEKETGQKFYVYNTHLDHKFASARHNQLATITTSMQQRNAADKNNNIILLGDFNTELTEEVLPVVGRMQLYNTKDFAKKIKGSAITSPGWYNNANSREIDHILIKNNSLVMIKEHVVFQQAGEQASDHYPVFVDICFLQH